MDLVADDDIDTEALQAQINMSMSFAEDLVSSWIKPAHKANLSKSTVDAQKLLDEQLRRPPRCVDIDGLVVWVNFLSLRRLGVGAPIPESSATARDAARLKHQLIGKGKKRAPEDETSLKPGHQSEEEEERKGGTVKKKMKLDPFAKRSKMKAKLNANSEFVTQSTHIPSTPRRQADGMDNKTGGDQEHILHGQSIPSSLNANKIDAEGSSVKKKRRKHSGKETNMRSQKQGIPQSPPQTSQATPSPDIESGSDHILSVNLQPALGSAASSVSFSVSGPFSPALQPGESPFLPS